MTRAARPLETSSKPSRSRMMRASRTGARLVSNARAMATELIEAPGSSAPWIIDAPTAWAIEKTNEFRATDRSKTRVRGHVRGRSANC